MSEETFGRKVHKPDVVVNDNDVGLLETDETMTNEEFSSVFYNTGVFNENNGNMVFNAEVINKFKRVLVYQKKLEPLREKIVTMQFEKYLENDDVDKENSKAIAISLMEESKMRNVTIFASKENGEYVYISSKDFRRMLKTLGDSTIRYLKISEGQFISLRIWAFDNDFDMIHSDEELKITFHSYETDESDEIDYTTEETSNDYSSLDKATRIAKESVGKNNTHEGNSRKANSQETLTESDYNAIFNTDYIESGDDIQIKPSVIKKLEKLITNMEAIKPVREQFAYYNVKKFIDEDVDIDNLICNEFEVSVNERTVCTVKVYKSQEKEDDLYINVFSFKMILIRTGSYYAIYLNGNKDAFVNLTKWAEESCGEIQVDMDSKKLQITF